MSVKPSPRQEKSDRTRHMLLESAMSLFQEYDIAQVTIDDICAGCGMTKGSFYHNFPSKDHVVTLTVNQFMDLYVAQNFKLDETRPLLEQFTALQLCTFDYFQQAGKKLTRTSYESQIRSCVEVRIPGRAYVDALTALVERGLREESFMMKLDMDNTYMMFIATYTGILMKWATQPDYPDNLIWRNMIEEQLKLMIRH